MKKYDINNIKKFKKTPIPKKIIKRMIWLDEYISNQTGTCNAQEIIKNIYSVADLYMKEHISNFSPCHKGCSYCCHVALDVTALEAIYIHSITDIEINHRSVKIDKTSACPFLKNDICSIYELRPLVCRLFASLEPVKMCKSPQSFHSLHSIKSSDFWLNIMGWFLLNSSKLTIGPFPISPLKDIREWFIKN